MIVQIPEEVPKPHNNDPLDPASATDMIIYVAIPLLLILLYFLWKKGKNTRRWVTLQQFFNASLLSYCKQSSSFDLYHQPWN